MSVSFLFVDLWQYCVCCVTSGTLLMVLYLDRMCQCGFHAVLLHLCAFSLQNLSVPNDFYSPTVSLWNDLADPVFDGVGLAGFNSRANAFSFCLSCSIPTIVFYYFSVSPHSVYWLVLWGWGLRTDRVYITLSQPCTADHF